MPERFTLKLEGVERAKTVLDGVRLVRGLRAGVQAAMIYLKGQVDNYPPKKSISRKDAYGATFFSDAQQRAFFAMLKSGEIEVPHRRRGSGGLGGKWVVREEGGGLSQILGNRARYARHVVGIRQARMMRMIGWRRVRDVYLEEKEAMRRIIVNQIRGRK